MTTQQQLNLQALLGRLGSNSLTSADIAVFTQTLTPIINAWGFGGSGAAPDLLSYGGQSDEQNARLWYATLYEIAQSTGGTPVVPASWLVPAWFIDPVNGSDLNNGTTSGTPLKTWAQLVNLWGTNAPILRQNTTITFLSSQPDNTDPVIFRPVIGNGAQITITGTLTVVTAGVVLAGLVAKNRATGQLLNFNLGATAAAGQLVRNTTGGKISRAWIYKNVAGNVWSLSQPLAPATFPLAAAPAEFDTWANGDTVDLLTLTNVHIVLLDPLMADVNAANTNGLAVTQINCFDPAADGTTTNLYVGSATSIWESSIGKILCGRTTQGAFNALSQVIGNVRNTVGVFGSWDGGPRSWIGGISGTGAGSFNLQGVDINIDGDHIFGTSASIITSAGQWGLGNIDSGVLVQNVGTSMNVVATFYGSQAVWGTGTLNTCGRAKTQYPTGAGAAVANLLVTTLQVNSTGTADSHTGAAPDVLNAGITTTAAHLDAAAGAAGFGGNAFTLGGASIQNFL